MKFVIYSFTFISFYLLIDLYLIFKYLFINYKLVARRIFKYIFVHLDALNTKRYYQTFQTKDIIW